MPAVSLERRSAPETLCPRFLYAPCAPKEVMGDGRVRRRPLRRAAATACLLPILAGGSSSRVALSSAGPVTALLPPRSPDGATARLRAEAHGGCFSWTSKRPDVVRVDFAETQECASNAAGNDGVSQKRGSCAPFGGDASCQTVAILESVSDTVGTSEKVLVTARDASKSGTEVFCEVHVAPIARLEVETRARHVGVGDVETLTAKAFDAQGNVFSSLEGLEFEWRVSDQGVLRGLPLADSALQLSPARRQLVQRGAQSDILPLRGIATGRAKVSVQLRRPRAGARSTVASPEVELVVAERLLVLPPLVHMPVGGILHPRLKIQPGFSADAPHRQADVPLPAAHFRWRAELEDGSGSALSVASDTGITIAKGVGIGRVVVDDSRIQDNSAHASVTVATPSKLMVTAVALQGAPRADEWQGMQEELDSHEGATSQLHSSGGIQGPGGWQLILGRVYALRLQLLDTSMRPLHVPRNFRVPMQCQTVSGERRACPLRVLRQTANSALIVVEAADLGEGVFSYADAVMRSGDRATRDTDWPTLFIRQPFRIVEPLQVHRPFQGALVLPPHHSYTLRASGGSGSYRYAITQMHPAGAFSITPSGTLRAGAVAGSADVLVSDANNAANNVTVTALVRHVGSLELRPPKLQLELGALEDGIVKVPVLARPAPAATEFDGLAEGERLHFWNCSSIRLAAGAADDDVGPTFVAHSSRPGIANAMMGSSQDATREGVCETVLVEPRSAGMFTLSVEMRGSIVRDAEADLDDTGSGADVPRRAARGTLRADTRLRVFAPLRLEVEGVKGSAENGTDANVPPSAVVAVCSSVTLRLFDGPVSADAGSSGGQVLHNVSVPLEGSHLRLRSLAKNVFEVVCLRPTPGHVRLTAEAWSDQGHALARATALIWCVTPVAAEVVALDESGEAPLRSRSPAGGEFGIRRGRSQRFALRLLDNEGRPVLTERARYRSRWSLDGWNVKGNNGRRFDDGLSTAGGDASEAFVTVPSITPLDAEGTLAVEAEAPTAESCGTTFSLNAASLAIAQNSLAAFASPLKGSLSLRTVDECMLRWPGHPGLHLPFAPQWAYEFEVTGGTGSASLSVERAAESSGLNDAVASVALVPEAKTCSGDQALVADAEEAGDCVRSVAASGGQRNASVQKWFVQATRPGRTKIVVADAKLLGGAPEAVDMTFLPAVRIALGIPDDTVIQSGALAMGRETESDVLLLVRGRRYPVNVDIWDTDNNTFGSESWRPLRLKVEASDLSLEISYPPRDVQRPGQRPERSVSIYPKTPGTFWVKAIAYNHEGAMLHSNTLNVHVFEPFGIAPSEIVLLPRQTFEYGIVGGPLAGIAANVHVDFSTSFESVAVVESPSGLVRAIAPGDVTITAQLVDSKTGLEIARSSARVAVIDPLGASILPDANTLGVIERGASEPVRLVAALHGRGGKVVSQVMLSAPSGPARLSKDENMGCKFQWSSSEESLSFFPREALDSVTGAAFVDILLPKKEGRCEQMNITVRADVKCPQGRPMVATRVLSAICPLRLEGVSPSAETLVLPPRGRLPLQFSEGRSHLRFDLSALPRGSAGRPCVELREDGGSTDLVAGEELGEASFLIRSVGGSEDALGDRRQSIHRLVRVRTPVFARLTPPTPFPGKLPVGAVLERKVVLIGERGEAIALPPSYAVHISTSHASVLSGDVRRSADGGAVLSLRAAGPGCASATVTVSASGRHLGDNPDSIDGGLGQVLGDTLVICVDKAAVTGRGQLQLTPGSRVQLSVDGGSVFARRSAVNDDEYPCQESRGISLRLACPTGGSRELMDEDVGAKLAREIADLLSLRAPPQVITVRWAPHSEPRPQNCVVAGVDVDLDVSELMSGASGSFGRIDMVEALWSHLDLRHSGVLLRMLDLERSARTTHESSLCAKRWTSSSPSVLETRIGVTAEEAIALRPGLATARLTSGGATVDIDVRVSGIGDVRAGRSLGSSLLDTTNCSGVDQASVVSNVGPLVVPLNFYAQAMPEGADAELELRSGPFHIQGISFSCVPTDPSLYDFFDFQSWSLRNVSDGDVRALFKAARESLPQAACVLRPRDLDLRRWGGSMPPRQFVLRVQVAHGSGSEGALSVQSVMQWPFVPQFVALDASGSAFDESSVAVVLSESEATATISVWTGGHPVEVSLGRQLSPTPFKGALGLQVKGNSASEPQAATISITLAWNSAISWGGVEDVVLRLESRSSCQVQLLRVRVDGRGALLAAPALNLELASGGYHKFVLLLLVLALGGCCAACTRDVAPAAPPTHTLASASLPRSVPGASAGRPFAATPMRVQTAGFGTGVSEMVGPSAALGARARRGVPLGAPSPFQPVGF
eukprot:TRINITY_DN19717_c0_g2_i1.p1 TRINITY_DN19717_c0_g2~~TRINITY_DN19717_c0_g2_i1.p1  ORF type:complete len:2341 (+),score=306.18 TRINITY_DN19717_c0_g2_i1:64-7086(+)